MGCGCGSGAQDGGGSVSKGFEGGSHSVHSLSLHCQPLGQAHCAFAVRVQFRMRRPGDRKGTQEAQASETCQVCLLSFVLSSHPRPSCRDSCPNHAKAAPPSLSPRASAFITSVIKGKHLGFFPLLMVQKIPTVKSRNSLQDFLSYSLAL